MAGDLNDEACIHVGLHAFPSSECRGQRIGAEIGDKPQIVTEVLERYLQLAGVGPLDRRTVISMPPNYRVHLGDIDANGR
jgi:hypothetical protein